MIIDWGVELNEIDIAYQLYGTSYQMIDFLKNRPGMKCAPNAYAKVIADMKPDLIKALKRLVH